MEKGANDTSNGFGVSDKKSLSNSGLVGSMMSSTHRQGTNLDRPFGSDGGGGGDGSTSGGVVGSANNIGGANEVVGNIYRDGVISSSGSGGRRENIIAKGTNLQPFDIFPYNHTIPNKSPAGTMAATLELPFTSAQWRELERQAMIYKYMISSVPVPSDLLFPISRDFPAADSSVSLYSSRYSKNGDPEPGRCKRTDGKKWRCSRDVAPHQKYCERHLHRGRPRSRKPVEVKSNAQIHQKTRTDQQIRSVPTLQSASASSRQQQFFAVAADNDPPLLLFNDKSDLSICTPAYKDSNRDLSLILENEQQWQHFVEPNMGLANNDGFSVYSNSGPIFQNQDYVEHQGLTFYPYPNFPAPEIQLPNGFIDAWSIGNVNRRNNGNVGSSVCLNDGDMSPSLNLSIAMASADILDKEMSTIEMGNTSVSWGPFARGGPLGEALQPIGDSNPTSPYNSISTQATMVSSPSGVLQRTLFSHSDGSVCNSPIRF